MTPADVIRIHLEFEETLLNLFEKYGAEMFEECLYELTAGHIIAFGNLERFTTTIKRFQQYAREIENEGSNGSGAGE